ncbi:MAG: hypothetical protein KBT33_10920 [Prevotellaceae bacterium]|nr:hypothetical protein [Candidatus Minthosoma equi]
MKRHHIYSLMLSAVAVAGTMFISSCSDYDYMSEEEIRIREAEKEYLDNFEARYGTIDPNHNWGFGKMSVLSLDTRATRANEPESAGAGYVDVNRNMWTEKQTQSDWTSGDFCINGTYYRYSNENALAKYTQIPGWPNFDGYYYTVGSAGEYSNIQKSLPDNSHQAAGDITDYEIQYVSEWFRTHKNPESIKLHLTDFFVQNVSGDNDRVSYPNGERITKVFDQSCDFGMDHIKFATMDSHSTIDDTWTHLNNYNNGSTNEMSNDVIADKTWKTATTAYNNNATHYREIKYVASSGTEDFAYTESFGVNEGENGTYHNNWVLKHLDWDEVGQDGKTYHRDGYYLAFDYQTQKDGEVYPADGYYSNWIIKITPAYPTPTPDPVIVKRIMCEDLGNTYDFDFNDIVFDVQYKGGEVAGTTDAVITLQAAGGTLPIYVGTNDSRYEAHGLLGNNPTNKPINVGANKSEVAIYRIKGVTSTDPDEIKIYVTNPGGKFVIDSHRANLENYNNGNKSNKYPPMKFCVPNTVKWTLESKQIESAYKNFGNWVQDENWTSNGKKWYELDINNSLLFQDNKVVELR